MATIDKYVLEDESGEQSDEYDTVHEAREAARVDKGNVAIVRFEYEYSDSSLVEVWRNGQRTEEDAWRTK